jgi:light-regulated signal transduction histidine kinase (bacteriophytochrome)
MKPRPPDEDPAEGSAVPAVVVVDADDDRAAQRTRRRHLTAAGFSVHPVAGASQVLEAAAAHQPDVVLLAADSPDAKEAEICGRLKSGSGKVPVVALLISSPKPKKEQPRCGADLSLPRALAPSLLIDALRTLLRLRTAEQALDQSRGEMVDFAMQLAHDIEGPLRGVVTFAELIGQAHPLSDDEQTYLRHVLASADQVRRLARYVLTYAQVKRDRPRLIEVQLRGVVAAAVQASRERIKQANGEIHVQDPLPSALGDFSALQQVFQSLITNAINYRCPKTSLSITIGAKESSAGERVIFVGDNGIGVAKEYQESIFAPFKRLHGPEIPGAGMGLAISKHIVEAHGGRIWVESELGRGASFVFTLRAPA